MVIIHAAVFIPIFLISVLLILPAETMNRYGTRVEHGFPCVKNDRIK